MDLELQWQWYFNDFCGFRLPAISLDHCRQYGDWITDWIAAWMGRGWSRGHIEDYSVGSIYGIQTLGHLIWTQRQGGEMIWNSIGLYFLGGLVQGEDNYSTCGDGLEAYWIMTNQLVNIQWFSSWCGYLGNVLLAFTRMLWTALSWGGMWCSICVTMPKAHCRGVVIAQLHAQDIHYKRRKFIRCYYIQWKVYSGREYKLFITRGGIYCVVVHTTDSYYGLQRWMSGRREY